ncbi:hypothetical protein [Agromyces sp. ZXT2-6]|uniref:hypothetical protein n=1 Tax=Agromyces sp. ZXT2-6 TaxID=3461153 RepID=UPI004054D8EC
MRTEPPTGDELTRMLVQMKRNVLEQAAAEPKPKRSKLTDRIVGGTLAVALLLGLGTAGAAIAGAIGRDDEPTEAVAATSEPVVAATTPEVPPRTFPIETEPPPPPPAVDPLTTVSTIAVRPEGLDLVDASGAVVAKLSYFDDPATFVGALTTVFAAQPTLQSDEELATSDSYSYFWPGGLLVAHDRVDEGRPIFVKFTGGSIGDGVTVTAGGYTPGDDLAAYAASVGLTIDGSDDGSRIPLEYGPEQGPSDGRYLDAWAVVGQSPGWVFAPYNLVTGAGQRG